eukprot:1364997-Amorphochlora_amoeboformis.AAC.1
MNNSRIPPTQTLHILNNTFLCFLRYHLGTRKLPAPHPTSINPPYPPTYHSDPIIHRESSYNRRPIPYHPSHPSSSVSSGPAHLTISYYIVRLHHPLSSDTSITISDCPAHPPSLVVRHTSIIIPYRPTPSSHIIPQPHHYHIHRPVSIVPHTLSHIIPQPHRHHHATDTLSSHPSCPIVPHTSSHIIPQPNHHHHATDTISSHPS